MDYAIRQAIESLHMKKVTRIPLLLISLALVVVACSQYDDTVITEKIDKLDQRVTAIEKWQAQINSQIQSLQTTVDALNSQDKITSVKPLDDGSGWVVSFEKSGTITILNGKNGDDGKDGKDGETPKLGVKLDEDGNYYWTVNGEYLRDEANNKISATAHISTPQIRINPETNKFEISYNNGETWDEIGDAGSSSFGIFSKIEDLTENVVFYLEDGTTIQLPKKIALALILDGTSFGVSAGSPTLIAYKVEGADESTIVDGFATNGYSVEVMPTNTSEGQLFIIPPTPLVEGKLFLIAFNNKETSAKVLSFEEGTLVVDQSAFSVPASGGNLSISVSTNLSFTVQVDYSALTWVSVIETKALRTEIIELAVEKNTSDESRSGTVDLLDEMGTPLQTITIVQAGNGTTPPASGGGKDDFSTMNSGEAGQYGDYTSTAGWTLSNGLIYNSESWDILTSVVPAIGGRTSKVGVLTSPIIEGGIGKLSFSYGSPAVISKGIAFKLEIKNEAGNIVKELQITDSSATQKAVYDFNEDINISEKVQLVFTNLCPANKRNGSYDATCIFNLEWTGYAE